MPRPDHTGMIDGYASVQALRRLDGRPSRARPLPADTVSGDGGAPPPPEGAAKTVPFGHTALPTRHELICYGCSYAFVVTGRLDKVLCPKCKTWLETGDQHIDGSWSGTLRTVGRVYINSGASVTSARIIATDIRVAGACSNSRLEPTRHLELDTGARLELDQLSAQQVVIIAGARLVLDEPLRCRSLDIHGELQADVRVSERTCIHPDAMFRGTLHTPRLVVHDGAGIRAFLHVGPAAGHGAASPSVPPEPAVAGRSGGGEGHSASQVQAAPPASGR